MKPALYIAASTLAALLFILFPALDIETARLFHRPGEGFFLKDSLPVVFVYESIIVLEDVAIGLVVLLIVAHFLPWLARLRARPAAIACIALSLAVGPGLVTNTLLKNEMGRARPSQVAEFGGPRSFSPPFVPSDQCATNCAFVTGHGALAFWTSVFAFLMAPGRGRRLALAGAVLFGTLTGLGRMAQGAHWLSDVIFAGVINIAIAWAICEWLDRRGGLARLARRMRKPA